ncbi:hypothetical protein DFJ73DRAFT_795245 [Zopfochytrium polystomum]|nr:hypothetical protein DFJ73DRAFT_795245 [Zopfochytrium polystomum]
MCALTTRWPSRYLALLLLFAAVSFFATALSSSGVHASPGSCISCLKPTDDSPLYRALNEQDRRNLDSGHGLHPTDPNANLHIMQQQRGIKPSQFISTTKSEFLARGKFNSDNGVVSIDRKKLRGAKLIDTAKHPKANRVGREGGGDNPVPAYLQSKAAGSQAFHGM